MIFFLLSGMEISWYFKCCKHQLLESLHMAEQIITSTVISAEEALRTEIILNQALIDILIVKGIFSEDELINSVRKVKREREILAGKWEYSS